MWLSRLFHLIPFIVSFALALIWYLLYKIFKREGFKNTAIGFDQTGNAMFGGNPDYTVSGRLGRKVQKGECKACIIFCKVLSWFFNEDYHCINSIEKDERD